jgi:hypothetical protein
MVEEELRGSGGDGEGGMSWEDVEEDGRVVEGVEFVVF